MASSRAAYDPENPSIVFIPFDKFKECGELPRLGITPEQRTTYALEPYQVLNLEDRRDMLQDWRNLAMDVSGRFIPAKDFLVDICDVDTSSSLLVFVSHRWLRGFEAAPGYDKRAHADDADHTKYKLVVEAVDKMLPALSPRMKNCYLWLDFSCINQDGEPAGELKRLDKLIEWCDVILTPVVDPHHASWDLPVVIKSWFTDYKAQGWNQGDHAYLNRAWCRVEMLMANRVPLRAASTAPDRLALFKGGLHFALKQGRRYHALYGSKESAMGSTRLPIALPPLQHSHFETYAPVQGTVTAESDKVKISELVEQLAQYSRELKVGYEGGRDSAGRKSGFGVLVAANGNEYRGEWLADKKHSSGVFTYSTGDVYEGEFRDGLKEGQGTWWYADGRVYTGGWKADKKHGRGTMTEGDGTVSECEYKDGEIVVPGASKTASVVSPASPVSPQESACCCCMQ